MAVRSFSPRPHFYRSNGKLRYSGHWSELAGDKKTILKVYADVMDYFGRPIARQVCNRLFIRGYPPSVILGIGSGLRSDAMRCIISLAGADPDRLVVHPPRLVYLAAA